MNCIKKILVTGIFFFGLFGLTIADVIPQNSHVFDRCVKIYDVDIVTGYKLVIHIQTMPGENYLYEVKAGECLPGHYKFGSATPILLNSTINIEDLNQMIFDNRENFDKILSQETFGEFTSIDVNGGYVSNRSNKTYENDVYKLVKKDNNYQLELISVETDDPYYGENGEKGMTAVKLQKVGKYNKYIFNFFKSRLLTIFLETIILYLICKIYLKKDNLKTGRIIYTGILASTITLPILWFIIPLYIHKWTVFVIFGELFVTIVEVVIIKYMLKINWNKSLFLSIICNFFSFLIGLLI